MSRKREGIVARIFALDVETVRGIVADRLRSAENRSSVKLGFGKISGSALVLPVARSRNFKLELVAFIQIHRIGVFVFAFGFSHLMFVARAVSPVAFHKHGAHAASHYIEITRIIRLRSRSKLRKCRLVFGYGRVKIEFMRKIRRRVPVDESIIFLRRRPSCCLFAFLDRFFFKFFRTVVISNGIFIFRRVGRIVSARDQHTHRSYANSRSNDKTCNFSSPFHLHTSLIFFGFLNYLTD